MKVFITGSNGLLGQKIVEYCQKNTIQYIAASKGVNRNVDCPESLYLELDLTDKEKVLRILKSEKPTHVIHTAALTNVDYCELHPEECQLVNVDATHHLIQACNSINAYFQLLSTDFVFDGEKGNYSEMDTPNPLSLYAKSKVNAEKLVKDLCINDWSIVRTIIVYGVGHDLSRSNIVVWAKETLQKEEPLNIVDDQYRAPTFAPDLAKACIQIAEKKLKGIYHIAGPETMSVYEIVERIAKHFNYRTDVIKRISSATLNQPAKRPPRTGFNLLKATQEINYRPLTLEESLEIIFN